MKESTLVSVIIPTYNRRDSLIRLVESLCRQSLDPRHLEVVVVDDGSEYDSQVIVGRAYPFPLKYIRQRNQGATVARNRGAEESRGEVLVFIDDDITVSKAALQTLAQACLEKPKTLAMGTLISRSVANASPYARVVIAEENERMRAQGPADLYVNFAACNTQLLAVKRADFFELGMLQDPSGGWPNWDDVDFGYRAHLAGFRLLQCSQAIGEHWDYSLESLNKASRRWFRASKSAVRLFQKHPELAAHIPMFTDKIPVNWPKDPARLILRKLLRRVTSSGLALVLLEKLAVLLEKYYPAPDLLRPLYRWVNGGYMFQGYRQGLHEAHRMNR
jgi:glycosyltransferase involved in cell wall biosynthesis